LFKERRELRVKLREEERYLCYDSRMTVRERERAGLPSGF
jgi:hypothetical protein